MKDYLPEGIELPAGKFYIGWEHPRGTSRDYIPFGFDKNYPDANQYIYYNVGGDWLNVATSSPTLKGAIALRPVVGYQDLLTGNKPEVEDLSHAIFPNPTRSELHFHSGYLPGDMHYEIYNTLGQISASGQLNSGATSLNVSQLTAGQYFLVLRYSDRRLHGHMRFIKQ